MKINKLKDDLAGWGGAFFYLILSAYALYRWKNTAYIFFLLLFIRDLCAVYFFLTRHQATHVKTSWVDFAAYLSSILQFFYLTQMTSTNALITLTANSLSIIGFTLSTFALLELGKSWGVAPANRGLVRTGVYKLFPHPMYLGYVISEIGFVLINPLNIFLFIFSCSLYALRAHLKIKP